MVKYLKKILGITALEEVQKRQLIFNAHSVKFMQVTADALQSHKSQILKQQETQIYELSKIIDKDILN